MPTTTGRPASSPPEPTRSFASKSKAVPPPKSVVPADSPLLLAYKEDIHPRQLTYRMQKRQGLGDLQDLLALYEHKLDHIAVAAALTRLYRLQKHDPGYTEARASALLEQISLRLNKNKVMEFVDFRTASTCLWALAGLKLAVPQTLVMRLLGKAATFQPKMDRAPPRRVALVAWAASKLLAHSQAGTPAKLKGYLDTIAASSMQRFHQFSPRDMAMLLLAFAAFKPAQDHQALFIGAAQAELKRIGDLSQQQYEPGDYVGLLKAFAEAKLGPVDALFGAVAKELVHEVRGTLYQFQPHQLLLLVEAYAAAGVRDPALMGAVARAVAPSAPILL